MAGAYGQLGLGSRESASEPQPVGVATLGIDGFVWAVAYGGHCGRGRGMGMGVSVCRACHQLASDIHLVLILTFGVDYGQAGTTIMGSWAAGAQKAPWSHGRFKGC